LDFRKNSRVEKVKRNGWSEIISVSPFISSPRLAALGCELYIAVGAKVHALLVHTNFIKPTN